MIFVNRTLKNTAQKIAALIWFSFIYSFPCSIPTGVFNHKVKLVGPSGVISNSIELFSTFTASQSAVRTKALSLTPGQSTQRTKGDSIFVSLDGQDITGLSTATLTDKNNNVTNLLNDSNFTHTETSLSIQPSGLNAGVYDIALQGTYGSASLDDVITIIGTPIVKGSEITIMSTGLINEPTVYSDLNTLQTQKYNAQWPFSLDKEPDKICLTFENSGVQTAKTASFRLGYNHGRNFNNIEEYYIKASGLTSTASMDRALAKYNSGIYTTDEYGDPFDSYSYKLQPCLCDITYSGAALFNKAHSFYRSGILTGLINGNTGTHPLVTGLKSGCVDDYNQYTSQHATKASCAKSGFLYSTDLLFDYNSQVNLTATGYSTGITIANIEQQIVNSYPGYGVSSYVHSGRDYREADTFSSGISYPIDTSIFSNYTHPYWENIRLSGMNTLYPNGYPGGKNLTTAYNYSNSSNLIYNTTLTGVGKTSTESISAIETQRLLNYSQCTTGTYSGQASYISETPFVTGRTYGFCTGDGMDTHAEVNGCSFSSYMTGILTGLIHNENERLHGEYGGDYTITSYSIATGVQTGNFIGCELVATGLTSGDAISRRNDLSSGYFWRGECVNDNEGGLLRTENVSNNRPNFGMDVPFAEEIAIDEWESRITGFFDKRYYVHYHPVVSVPQHKSTAHVSCPNTNFNVVLERDEENWTTTGNAYKKDIRRMNVTLKANCSGYETNLTTRCNRITAGIEWYCPKPFTNTINACWEDDFEKGNYLINYTSGAYELANNKWFIGTGNLNATQII